MFGVKVDEKQLGLLVAEAIIIYNGCVNGHINIQWLRKWAMSVVTTIIKFQPFISHR